MKIKFSLIGLAIAVVASVVGICGYNKYKNYKEQVDYITREYGNLQGYVKSINGEIFTVSKITTTKAGNGYASVDSGKQVKFQCSKNTKIVERNTSDNGLKTKDTPGSLIDIKKDKMVSVWGDKQVDIIKAETVVVFKFN